LGDSGGVVEKQPKNRLGRERSISGDLVIKTKIRIWRGKRGPKEKGGGLAKMLFSLDIDGLYSVAKGEVGEILGGLWPGVQPSASPVVATLVARRKSSTYLSPGDLLWGVTKQG